jgi:hypothetical protein
MKHTLTLLLLICLAMSACNGKKPGTTGVQPEETPSGTGQVHDQVDAGSRPTSQIGGAINLEDPSTGLQALVRYQATMIETYQGAGTSWTMTYDIHASNHARMLVYAETGTAADPLYPALQAHFGEVYYWQSDQDGPCVISYSDPQVDYLQRMPEPAGLLPPVRQLVEDGDPGEINGELVLPYRVVPSGYGELAEGRINGRVWLAKDGGHVVRYSLSAEIDDNFPGTPPGVYSWDYNLTRMSENFHRPEGCPPALPHITLPEDVYDVVRFPDSISFSSSSDHQTVHSFLSEQLTAVGFKTVTEVSGSRQGRTMRFWGDDMAVVVSIWGELETQVNIYPSMKALPNPVQVQPIQPSSDPAVEQAQRIASALDALVGSAHTPPQLPSFHLELKDSTPAWDSGAGAIVLKPQTLSADVEGTDVHFRNQSLNKVTEVIILGEEEYEVIAGVPSPSLGLAGLAWINWQLKPAMILAQAATSIVESGQDTIDGMITDWYRFDATSDPMSSFGPLSVTGSKGILWIDRKSGALLKLEADYTASVSDTSGNSKGSENGRLEIVISQIGQVTVSLDH